MVSDLFPVQSSKLLQISYWKKRVLRPLGKNIVVKSISLPLFTHCLTSLPTHNTAFLKTFNDLFYDFIWEGKAKIKQSVIIKKYKEGGPNMVDISSYVHSLKTRSCCALDFQGSDPNVARDKSSQCGDHFCEIVVKSDFK
jgi:hypothetical protein